MDCNDINDISEKVDQAINCAKKRLTPSGDSLIIQPNEKRHDLPQGCSAKKVQTSISERKKTLLFSKSREKSGNDEAVLLSQVIYRKRS